MYGFKKRQNFKYYRKLKVNTFWGYPLCQKNNLKG